MSQFSTKLDESFFRTVCLIENRFCKKKIICLFIIKKKLVNKKYFPVKKKLFDFSKVFSFYFE